MNTASKEKFISESTKFALAKIFNYLDPKVRQVLENQIIEYTVNNALNFSLIKTILHKDNVNLAQIYQPLTIKHKTNDGTFLIDDFKKFIENHKNISLIASGGSGKTTFIKNFYIKCVKEGYKIPVIFNFREFNQFQIKKIIKDKDITENYVFIAFTQHLLFNKIGIDSKTIEKMFDSGEFIFFLDGYDELDNKIKTSITKDFQDFVTRFNNNRFIITTRPYTSANYLDNFSNIYLSGLEDFEQITSFIHKQLYNNPSFAESIIATLKQKSSKKYLEILSNPLFLILFINAYESYPNIPPKKTQFYWQVFDALFEKHETFSKTGYRRPKLTNLDREKFEKILHTFSFISYFDELFIFSESQYEAIIRKVLTNYKYRVNPKNFLEDLKVSISILVEDGKLLSFIHRSIQEYFAAKYVDILSEDDKADFMLQLAKEQNSIKGNHTFLIELISELYPYEFKKYYIKAHIEEFYDNKEFYLTEHDNLSGYDKVFDGFENFKTILSFSKEFQKLYIDFMKTNSFTNENINIIVSSRNHQQLKLAQEILTLYENKELFYLKMSSFIKDLDESNKPILKFAFRGI
ncbi:hypothetical protein SAMN05660477_03120 [Soonwooa buanensis]|uniref:NACHT domain-containing protein n=1 Tax=Soonwooa buanensis TaxID=619805 RepID=A0A1T5GSZ0_9FLAO|nr:hypothetical protein [Soonwooa buanensis]SKC11514.1 hypothetical protein SAMN05660477_03120 [Soonwooa buanensis]